MVCFVACDKVLQTLFTFLPHTRRYYIRVKFDIHFFQRMSTFHNPLNLKKDFLNPVCPIFIVIVVFIYGYDNSRKNYQILNAIYQGQKIT